MAVVEEEAREQGGVFGVEECLTGEYVKYETPIGIISILFGVCYPSKEF